MAYYGDTAWAHPARQASASWELQPPPSRSGMGSNSAAAPEDGLAFITQFEEVDRAVDNLVKNGGPLRPGFDFDARIAASPRHHSLSEFAAMPPRDMGNVQHYYATQRFGGDQIMQAKRRMAAQRERELRNYHQEQKYNRSVLSDMPSSGGTKSDRSQSPSSGMTEDDRRELIARQHRALYGDQSNLHPSDASSSRPMSQDARVGGLGGRGPSPLAFDSFGMPAAGAGDNSAVQMPSRDQASAAPKEAGTRSRANSNSAPASNATPSFGLFDTAQQSSRTCNSSPTSGSPPHQGSKTATSAAPGVGTIGSRPLGIQAPGGGSGQPLSKRLTTPLPSPLSYGFSASEQQSGGKNERTNSAASNPAGTGVGDKGVGLGWGGNSGVWGNNSNKLGVQASVWG